MKDGTAAGWCRIGAGKRINSDALFKCKIMIGPDRLGAVTLGDLANIVSNEI